MITRVCKIALSLGCLLITVSGFSEEALYPQHSELYQDSFTFDQVGKDKWVLESENAYVIEDIRPQAPVHVLVIPKQVIPTIMHADQALLGELMALVQQAAKHYKIDQTGFKTMISTHPEGGQGVYHLHIHVLGGRPLETSFN